MPSGLTAFTLTLCSMMGCSWLLCTEDKWDPSDTNRTSQTSSSRLPRVSPTMMALYLRSPWDSTVTATLRESIRPEPGSVQKKGNSC
eukprot:CAMPEP_0204344118 /NCGR_PEP_ID=MMETSP0469-20131031/25394_1 /ASSEMBLY_ACC=CAM_ASM_000384 /TAXON_ID=2969 /ORGANISM="Oxyrrhis marina" /LENGTH=86 /DNA_ID=CAMNT_0051329337 /DNA_START=68 /DNA_END=325 /DNA_ORIENTATION=-